MFTISTRTRYGMRALIQLSTHTNGRPVPLNVIASEEGISLKYLENIFHLLKKAGIVTSIRGPEGGYRLGRDAEKLSVYEIMDAIDGPLIIVHCVQDGDGCARRDICAVNPLWQDLLDNIEQFLQQRTLADLRTTYEKKRSRSKK